MEKEINVAALDNLIVPEKEMLIIKDYLDANPDLLIPEFEKIQVRREKKWNDELMAYEHIPYLIIRKKNQKAKKFNMSSIFWISKKLMTERDFGEPRYYYTLKRIGVDEKEMVGEIIDLGKNDYIQKLVVGLENFIKPKINYFSYSEAKESFFKALTLVDGSFKGLVNSREDVNVLNRNILFDLWISWDHKNRVRCLVIIACLHYKKLYDEVKLFWKGQQIKVKNNWGLGKIMAEIR